MADLTQRSTLRDAIIWLVVILLLVIPRFDRIERPVTVDELTWLTFSSDFYYGLGQREFEHTYQDHHPGVTTMWAGTGAFLMEFPEYRGLGQGYMENDPFKLVAFLADQGVDAYNLLIRARQLMAAASVIGLLVSFWLLWRMFNPLTALSMMFFIALDPFVLGQTRLYSHEGLMSVLVLLSWVSFFYYYRAGKQKFTLALSGLAAGGALLTKITAGALLPMVGVFWLAELLGNKFGRKRLTQREVFRAMAELIIWGGIVVLVFYMLWPAMWSSPVGRISSLISHTGGFSQNQMATSSGFLRIMDYLASIWSHTTLITWVGVGLFLAAVVFKKQVNPRENSLGVVGFTLPYSLVVVLMLSLVVVSIRGTRYMSSVHLFLSLAAGAGTAAFLVWFSRRKINVYQFVPAVMLIVVVMAQLITILPSAPYYYVYNQPLHFNRWWGYHGAFMDQAGDFLAEIPGSEEMTIMAYSPGSIMHQFPGQVTMLKPSVEWGEAEVGHLAVSDYLVFDLFLRNHRFAPRVVSDIEFAGIEPFYLVEYQGRTVVYVYQVSDLPPEAFVPDQ